MPPDPVLFAKGVIATAVASAVFVLAAGWDRQAPSALRINAASLLAVALAMALGCHVVAILPRWPAANVLDRYFLFVLPGAALVELLAAVPRVPRWLAWGLRAGLAAATGPILLYKSSYLEGSADGWSTCDIWTALLAAAVLLLLVWGLTARLLKQSPGFSISLAVTETALAGGLVVMLSAYPTGGATAVPLAAALVGAVAGSWLLTARPATGGSLGFTLVGIFGVLMMGRFFGALSTERALLVLLAPLLCWVAEVPPLRRRPPWQVAILRLVLVAVPLIVALVLAQRDFARSMSNSDGY